MAACSPFAPVTPVCHSRGAGPREQQLVLSIEGNIGIGKSTLLGRLRKRFALDPDVVFVDEPVDLWESSGLLEAMYSGTIDKCSFQQMAVITRFAALKKAIETGAKLIITERSIHTDRECFAKVGITTPSEAAAYAVTHDSLNQTLPRNLRMAAILLEAPLDVISKRIRMRGRSAEQADDEEEGGVVDGYLEQLQQAHVAYFASLCEGEKLCVDATRSPDMVEASVFAAISQFRDIAAY